MSVSEEGKLGGHHYDKYASNNPLVRFVVGRYLQSVLELVREAKPASVLDVGCGEGYVSNHLKSSGVEAEFAGVDVSSSVLLNKARKINPEGVFACSSAYELCFRDRAFDLVLLSEVLEHLSEPERGLEEAKRVSRKYVLATVPNEPYWRLANMLRLSYLRDLGNTPGHIQHYTKKKLEEFLWRHFNRVQVLHSTIWITALCRD